MVDLHSMGHQAVMACINAYEFVVFTCCLFLKDYFNRAVNYHFKRAGIQVSGPKDIKKKKLQKGDIQVNHAKFYPVIAAYRTMGLGESYMNGYWDCTDLEEFFTKVYAKNLHRIFFNPVNRFINYLQFQLFNLQTETRAFEVGEKHYDQGNTLFEAMLDKTMNYSCGYWKDAKNLDEAQQNKMDLIAHKLKLKPGMKVLDIGCGWGALCKHLSEKYQVSVVGITISVEGAKAATERCEGLPVDIRVMDYRDLDEKFDRIVSVGMFEHVGHQNYKTYFDVAHRCLKNDGLFLLHSIGVNSPDMPLIEPWFNTYIFPNGILPTQKHITNETDGKFIIEDWQNIGHHYCLTLRAWLDKFNAAWPTLKKGYKDPEKFYRMWTYYLQLSAACFRSRKYQCWQVVLSKRGVAGGYDSPR